MYHIICYRGKNECLQMLLNFDRMCLKKVLYDELQRAKTQYGIKSVDIKDGQLDPTIQHDSDTIKRHQEFTIKLSLFLTQYVRDLMSRYR